MLAQLDLSIKYELLSANIDENDVLYIMDRVKNRLTEENIDYELQKLGYEKYFTSDYNECDEYAFLDIQFIKNKSEVIRIKRIEE
ncbi:MULTISPECIES: hypothetical protein [Arcobacteraceae]|uniref:Uncharacterized protein n=1 Tax=Poseidonibacter parvus TaxID=1850254 RepID=A0A1P8KKA4_9BACT|nr:MULTISPECIES: hypothetical protein [Arcobacteraceae]APW64988.1 hypothetical protein LPB137_03635 [Poseidonibacter parvus]